MAEAVERALADGEHLVVEAGTGVGKSFAYLVPAIQYVTAEPPPAVWDEVQSDSSNCLGRKCPTYKDCFYFRARRRVFNAQILIVNHALFFSDLALRRSGASILPDYDAVILDEAHTLEAVAGDHLGLSVTSGQVQFILNKLYNDRTNKGLLVTRKLRDAQDLTVECHGQADELVADILALRGRPGNRTGPIR